MTLEGKALKDDVAPRSEITPCIKIDKPLVVDIFRVTLRNDNLPQGATGWYALWYFLNILTYFLKSRIW